MKMLNPQRKAITHIQKLCLEKSHQDCHEVVMSTALSWSLNTALFGETLAELMQKRGEYEHHFGLLCGVFWRIFF